MKAPGLYVFTLIFWCYVDMYRQESGSCCTPLPFLTYFLPFHLSRFSFYINKLKFRARGKESTEVRKSQNRVKESENSYQKLKRSPRDRHTKTHVNCIEIFRLARPSFSIERVNVCEHTTKTASLESLRKVPLVTPSLSCVHKHLLSFDWGRWPCQSKYLDSVSVCLCVPVPFVISSIPGKSFHFPFP